MVHVKDEGGHFDAPLEVVWQYLQTPDAHSAAHASTRHQRVKPLGENTVLVTLEQNMNGGWVRVSNRLTIVPPLGVAVEVLEGPLAGSKLFNVYSAKGSKTTVDVYGEFVSRQIPPAQLEASVKAFLDGIYKEDAAAIKAFAAKR